MKNRKSVPDFSAFTQAAKSYKENTPSREEYNYLQVRLTKEDANRFKSAIVGKGLTVQSILIESINMWMTMNGYVPISDPGTSRPKT